MRKSCARALFAGIGLLMSGLGNAQETCREVGRALAADGSNDEVVYRECRSPKVADPQKIEDRAEPAMAGAPSSVAPGWQPGPKNDPDTCKALWEKIGFPVHPAEELGPGSVPVCHKRYVLMHNNATRIPDWVLEHLTTALFRFQVDA